MSLCDQALAYVRGITPYPPGKPITQLAREMGIPVNNIVKLASNENPRGMSPKARLAVEKAIGGLERYPDDFELKQAISDRIGRSRDHIVLGNGSNDVLDLIARVFLSQGRSAICSKHAFAVYPLATISTGARLIETPAKDFGHDLEAMYASIAEDTRLIWIANPNNPTGSFIPYPDLKRFLMRVPRDIVVVIDEAYNDYIPHALRVDTQAWLQEFPNLVIVRTFSKIYGLAGLRIGFGVADPKIADLMNRVRQPFNANNLALAGAVAALDDHTFLQESFALNAEGMVLLTEHFKRLGLTYIPSQGNFVTVRVGDATSVNQKLLREGVIVRPIAGYGMPEWLRVTIGTERENKRFLESLERAL